jgi:hypothetical protein
MTDPHRDRSLGHSGLCIKTNKNKKNGSMVMKMKRDAGPISEVG